MVIVDYGMGNLRSVEKAFQKNGAQVKISSRRSDILKAEKIILPGVGAFTAAVNELKRLGLFELIKERILSGTPYLGLCLGLQLLFSESEENEGKKKAKGFGIIPGRVRRFKGNFKIPHMGWNTLEVVKKNCPLFKGIPPGDYFYFVHSFYGVPDDKGWVASETMYGVNFCSSVWKGNIFATQFHPEKSQMAGLKIIKNFMNYVPNPSH